MKTRSNRRNKEEVRIPNEKREEFVSNLISWGKINQRDFPWRNNRDPYKVFISEILLKRTTSKAVSKLFVSFISEFPSINDTSSASLKDLRTILKPIGLYRQRSEALKTSCEFIMNEFNGVLPKSATELKKIPSIGDYTAGCILSFGYGIPASIVDSNVIRVISRAFKGHLNSRVIRINKIKPIVEELLPQESHVEFNYSLLDLGGVICRYKSPKCFNCPVQRICDFNSNPQ